MTVAIVYKSLALWLAILILAIANGALRESLLIPTLGSTPGLILSGTFLSLIIVAVAYLALPWYGPLPIAVYLQIGLIWLVSTLAFEFGFGRLVQHKEWSELLQAYTFHGGNIWPLVLAVTLIAPWLAARLRELV